MDKNERNIRDVELIHEVLAGNDNAFAELRDSYYHQIKIAVKKMISDDDDAEDLVQDTFIKVYHALDRFKEGYTFSSWIYRIASNTCIDFLRKKRFQHISISRPMPTGGEDDMYLEIEDRDPVADSSLVAQERKAALEDAVRNLPEKYRYIINLRHECDMDYKDIADKLQMPLGTVKARLFRARKLLLEELRKFPAFNSDFE